MMLGALARLWALQQALILLFTGLRTPWQQAQALLVLASAALPEAALSPFLCAAITLRAIDLASAAPYAWESFYWCIETDAALLLSLLGAMADHRTPFPPLAARDALVRAAAATVRWQLTCFYSSAALFKLNASFLDSRFSCAPIYVAQLLVGYAPASARVASSALAASIVSAAPTVVVLGEVAIGASLFVAAAARGIRLRRAAACVGVLLALLLHLGIALTPPPNNVGAFSVIMATRLFFFAPAHVATWCSPRAWGIHGCALLALTTAAITAAAIAAAAPPPSSQSSASEGGVGQLGIMFFAGVDWAVACFTLQMLLVGRGVLAAATAPAAAPPRPVGRRCGAAHGGLVLLAAVHSFALPVLGLQDLGGSNMFGNLRMQGGSNHLFLPTSLLQLVLPDSTAAIVRVESTNASAITSLYPGEVTAVLAADARALLRRAGHTGRQFNFAMGRVLGPAVLPPPAAAVRYTVPATELRRMLAEARAEARRTGVPFALAYAKLPSRVGDEAWRADGSYAAVRVVDDGVTARCRVDGGGACGVEELALLPELSAVERLLGVWNPYPILEAVQGHDPRGSRQVHCFGP